MASYEDINRTLKVTEYVEAYDFEVYDIIKTMEFATTFRPFMFLTVTLYVSGIYFGQKWMKDRPAFQLNRTLFLWNVCLCVFSIIATVRGLPEFVYLLSKPNGLYLTVCSGESHSYATSFWGLMFLISKFVELGDTAFIILRKQKLIVLHWFHHVATLAGCWFGFEYYDAIARFYVVNTFIHSLMYFYYALRALKVKIPRRVAMTLTVLQILQMVCYLFCNAYSIQKINEGLPCARHENIILLSKLLIASFLILFLNFFVHTYFQQDQKRKAQ